MYCSNDEQNTLLLFYTKTPSSADIQLLLNTKKRAESPFFRFTLYLKNKTWREDAI
ncbi:hypothetical protein B4129_3591 [Bacillus safensis]|nr:hypothetical protein B4129_3591 [Bacillus safensis]